MTTISMLGYVALAGSLTGPAPRAPVAPEPCVAATPACTEWVVPPGSAGRTLIYRTYSLDAKNPAITRALVMVHGAGRDADGYFRSALAAAFLADALGNTIVIAPRFASQDGNCNDSLATGEISWTCTGNSWRSGGPATNYDKVTSFDVMDEILRKLARKDVFPNLKLIVVTGHSAGGQYSTRYEMANLVHDKLGVPVMYVVSNPSSYAYLDPERPAGETGELRLFFEGRNCTTYNHWPYGLEGKAGYTGNIPDDQLKKQLVERPTTYLLGGLDTQPLAGFDSSCPAMAQGPNRLARGQAFARYVQQKYGAKHQVLVIPLCGHNARCMYTADPALKILFPSP
jgi:pimeloyl-ACP methyl ester carboxylesterase